MLKAAIRDDNPLIVHQAVNFMGFGAEVAAQLQEKAFDYQLLC